MTDGGLDYTFECVGNVGTMVWIFFLLRIHNLFVTTISLFYGFVDRLCQVCCNLCTGAVAGLCVFCVFGVVAAADGALWYS